MHNAYKFNMSLIHAQALFYCLLGESAEWEVISNEDGIITKVLR